MATIGTVEGEIKLRDTFTGPLAAASAKLDAFAQKVNSIGTMRGARGGGPQALEKQFNRLAGQLDPAIRSTQRMAAAQQTLDKALSAGLVNQREYARLLALAGNNYTTATRAGSNFASHIKNTLLHVGTAVVAFKGLSAAISSVGKTVEFERTLTKIANLTSVSRQEVKAFTAELPGLRAASGRGPQELADAFLSIASTGSDATETTERLAASAKLAAIGLGETNTIGRALSATINAYGRENISAAQAADQLLATVREGGAEAAEVASVIGRVVGVAKLMGVSFAEVGASIATFTRLGVGADEAVTALRGTMMAMLNPSKGATDALAAMGMTMADLRAQVKEKGLAATLVDLVKATKGNEEALADIIPNVRALAGVLANAGSQAEAYQEILQRMEESSGDVARAMEDVRNSASFRWDVLKSQFESLAITFGTALLPGAEALGKALASVSENDLREFGNTATTALEQVAKLVSLLVQNLDELKAVLIAIIGMKLGVALASWASGLTAAAAAARTATIATTALAASIRLISPLVAIAVGALLYLSDKAKEYSRNAQQEIENIVNEAAEAGRALDIIMSKGAQATQAGYLAQVEALNRNLERRAQILKEIKELESQPQTEEVFAPAGSPMAGERIGTIQSAAAARIKVLREEFDLVQKNVQLHSKATETISLTAVMTGRWGEEVDKTQYEWDEFWGAWVKKKEVVDRGLGDLTDAQENFAQRIEETTQRLREQLEVALALESEAETSSRRRVRGEAGELAVLDAEIKISQEKRIQLAITRAIAALENAKFKLTDQQRAAIAQMTADTIRAEDRTKRLTAQTRLATRQWEVLADRAKDAIAEAARFGDEIQQGLAQVAVDLTNSEKVLSALLAGGPEMARYVELEAHFREQNIENASELASWLVQIEKRQEQVNYLIAKVAEVSTPAWKRYADAAFAAMDSVVDIFGDAMTQMLKEGEVNWDSLWDSLRDTAIDIFVDLMKQMLKQWLYTQAAMAATDYAGGGGGGMFGGMGGGGGWMNMFSSFFGGGGGAAAGGAKAGMAGNAGVKAGASATSKGGAAAGSSSGALAAAGWGALIVGLVLAGRNQIKTSGRAESDTEIVFGQGQGIQLGPNTRHNKQVSAGEFQRQIEAIEKLIDDVISFIGSLGGSIDRTIEETSRLLVGREGRGKKTNWFVKYADGLVKHFGDDMEAAFEFAMVQAIRQAPAVGLSPEIATVLRNTTAEDMDELQADIDVGLAVLRARIGDVGADIYDIFRSFEQQIAAAQALGLETDSLVAAREREIEAIRHQMLGINTSVSDFLRDLRSFQDGVDQTAISMRASIEANIADIERQIQEHLSRGSAGSGGTGLGTGAGGRGGGRGGGMGQMIDFSEVDPVLEELQRQLDEYIAQLERIPKALSEQELSMAIFDQLYQYLEGSQKYEKQRVAYARLKVEMEFELIKQQLILLNKWAEFEGMWNDARAAALREAGKKPRGTGGADAAARRDTQQGIRREVSTFGMSPVARALLEVDVWLEEFSKRIREAGFSAAESSKLLAEAAAEATRRQNEIRADVASQFQTFMSGGVVNPFQTLRDNFNTVVKSINDAGYGAERTARMIDRATESFDRQMEVLAKHEFVSLGDDIFSFIERYYGEVEGFDDVRLAMEQLRFALELDNLKARFALLKAEGKLSDDLIGKIQGLFDFIDLNLPDLLGPSGGGGDEGPVLPNDYATRGPGGRPASEFEDLNRLRERALELLRKYQDMGKDSLTLALEQINRDFEEIVKGLGNTAEVINEKNEAISRAVDEFLSGIREMRDGMKFDATSTLTGREQFFEAQRQFREQLGSVLGGDLTKVEGFEEFAQRYLELGRDFTAGEGFRFISKEVEDALNTILNSVPAMVGVAGTPGLSTVLPSVGEVVSMPMYTQSPALQSAVETGNTLLLSELRSQTVVMKQQDAKLGQMANALDNPLSVLVQNIA